MTNKILNSQKGTKPIEYFLKKYGILKYNGRLIIPHDDGYFYVAGRRHKTIELAKTNIDEIRRRGKQKAA